MYLTRLCLENRTTTLVLLAMLFLAGLGAYGSLPRAEDPGFKIRTVVVTTFLPGATPERVELLVTDRLEKAIEEIPEVDYVTSQSRTGASVIEVNFGEKYLDLEPLFSDLRDKIDNVRSDLPAEVIGPQINDDFDDVFGTVLALTGDGFDRVELERGAEQIRNRLLDLDDVAKVDLIGTQEQRVFIEYDESRLAEAGVTPLQMANILQARNILDPSGDVRSERERFILDVQGSFDSVSAIRDTVIRLPSGALTAIGDLAEVRRGTVDPPVVSATYSGEPAVIMAVAMREEGNITELGPEVLQKVDRLIQEYPIGLDVHLVSYQTTQVNKSVDNFVASLMQGIGVVLVVMLLTLGLRTGLIVAAIIPMTMVGSLVFMQFFDITINQMSLAALIISLGLLVDSGIVMAESIVVSIREGRSPIAAALDSARELRLPLLVSSLTTAAALLPTYLAESTTGEYTSAIFEVVTISLLLAWVLSLTLTPLLSVAFARTTGAARDADADANADAAEKDEAADRAKAVDGAVLPGYDTRFYRGYRTLLLGLVRRPLIALLGFIVVLGTAGWAFQFVPQLFFPRKEQTTFTVQLELPENAPWQYTERVTLDVERFIQRELLADGLVDSSQRWLPNTERDFERHGVVNWASFIGSGAPRFFLGYNPEQPRPNYTFMLANASGYGVQARLIEEIEGYIRERWPDVTPRVEKLRNGPPLDYPLEFRLSGDDLDRLFDNVRALERELAAEPGVINVGNDWGIWTKTLSVEVDDNRARRADLTRRDVALSLQTATSGLTLTQYREGNDLIPVVLRSRAARADRVDQLTGLQVGNQLGGPRVALEQIADLGVDMRPAQVLRRDRKRTVTVHADLDPNAHRTVTPFSVVASVEPWLAARAEGWRPTETYEIGGEVESSGDAQASINAKGPIALIVIVSLLMLQFNAIRETAIVLMTLPFTIVGVVGALLLTQKPFGFMALLGVIALIGVVINNAVVLLDRIRIEIRDHRRDRASAVLIASQRRLRPILLTTATTVGGLIPLYLTGGPMFSPMAVALLGGLVVSTALTLGLVPVLYTLLFRLRYRDA